MRRDRKSISPATAILIKELKKEARAKKIETFLLFLTILSTVSFILLFTSHYLSTGYAVILESKAGDITSVIIEKTFPTTYWNGIYGLAIRVPGFTEQLYDSFEGEIARQDLFFDCIDTSLESNEVYASTVQTPDFNSLVAATPAQIDAYIGCSGREDCASNTFTGNMSVMIGSRNVTNIPSTYTYRWDGENRVFDIGALVDSSGNIVYVTHISVLQKGYSPNVTVNYQMLVPTPEYTSETYYFFTDPNDECPAGGGIGTTIIATIFGYVKDFLGNPIANASVTFAGITQNSSASGFYNFSTTLTPGIYNIITQKPLYDDNFTTVNITFENYSIQKNITLLPETPGSSETIISHVHGYIFDDLGLPIIDAQVSISGATIATNIFGYYSLYPSLSPQNHSLIATSEGYNNNYSIIDFSSSPPEVMVNLTLTEINPEVEQLIYPTGPYTQQRISNIIEEAIKNGEDHWISTREIIKEVRRNTFVEESIGIYNFGGTMSLVFSLPKELEEIIVLEQKSLTIQPNSFGELTMTIYGTAPLGTYKGNLTISGSISQTIPITIEIVERRMPIETMLIKADIFNPNLKKGDILKYKLSLQNLLSDQNYLVKIKTEVKGTNGSTVYAEKEDTQEIQTMLTLLEELQLPADIPNGEYHLNIKAMYFNLVSTVTVPFQVTQPIYLYAFFGIPLWIYLGIISLLSFVLLILLIYKRHLDKMKRYKVAVDYSTLPQPGPRVINLGHIAETTKDALFEIDRLTVHTIVAGATGMGKSISAQVLIEEALMKNICVIVFDPTAQWSGMLRKCEDKKMISFYPKFGLKPSDARGFPGNIRAVKDARQIIDINKYFAPGHIQIFTLNKLQPKDMDIFVANVIRQVFKSDPKESPDLKILLVFDEVHRLLPKFGGQGEGFLQIERGCREFRKWGIGQLLISQVMNDFVGEIKANINTEVQTRTVEEGDLERIKSKYGDSFLKSLVKSEVGVAMFQNAEYNRGLPYFINFRPILHNTRRLSDEELEKYNQYNDQVEDLEYQVEQLEELKIDVFDLKMELKLVKDKIMVGNFSVVDIYLEGLTPRIQKQWEKLGKTPKKKEIELADLEEIKKSVAEAQKERSKIEDKEKITATAEKVASQKEENMEEKQFQPITFDNGVMVSTLAELRDVLPNMDADVFKIHVNETKNEIAKWFEQISPDFATKLKPIIDKTKMIEEIKTFKGKSEPQPQPKAVSPSPNTTKPKEAK
jgi:hypothetical protein